MSKSILQIIYSCSVQKERFKKHQIFEKWDHFSNRPSCKGYSPCKMFAFWSKIKISKKHVKILSLGQKLGFQGNMSKSILQIIYSYSVQKERSKKHYILEKWDHFKSRPSCKGYSPCEIVTLGQKLKFQKTWQNPFYKSFTVILRKNRSKNH